MEEREFEGKDVKEAVEKGLKETGLKVEEVDIEVIDEGKKGFLGIGSSQPARVRIRRKKTGPDVLAKAREILSEILRLMNIEGRIETLQDKERMVLEIESKDSALLIGKDGKTLRALQLLTNLIMNRGCEKRTRIFIDIEQYIKRHEEKLIEFAKEIAQEVKRTRKQRTLRDMGPDDRRVVHMALQDEPGIETVSEGDGRERCLIIRSK